MFIDNFVLFSVVGWVAVALLVVVYYTFLVEQIPLYEPPFELEDEGGDHIPELDEELLYLASAMYPYHEFIHHIGAFPTSKPPEHKSAA